MRRIVFFFEQREDRVAAFVHINLRIGFGEAQHAVEKRDAFELRTKQIPIYAIIFRPIFCAHRAHACEQLGDVLAARRD